MSRYRRLSKFVLGAALLGSLGVAGCGRSEPEIVKANVQAGEMPADGNWRGVYYDEVYGYLHLLRDGSNVHGRWRTTAGEKWGELHGKVEGDLLRYDWAEHRIGMFGPNATTTGKGYFKYVVPSGENVDHEIHGEWGLGENEAGYPWTAIKQRNMQPEPDSVLPDETQTTVQGADWDGDESPNAAGAKGKGKPKNNNEDEDAWE